MKKKYEIPEFDVHKIKFVDCLAVSQSVDPENPVPDLGADGDGGDGDFDFGFTF